MKKILTDILGQYLLPFAIYFFSFWLKIAFIVVILAIKEVKN